MKTGYDNLYYLCQKCNTIYDGYGRIITKEPTDKQKESLIKGHCTDCYKEGLKNVKVTHWDYDIVEKIK